MPVLVDRGRADQTVGQTIARMVVRRQLQEQQEADRARIEEELARLPVPGIVEWAEQHFYIEETRRPIRLALFQKALLRHIFAKDTDGRLPYTTVVWSQPKKSGKTAIAGMVGRYVAETQGAYQEIYSLANDLEQAVGRIFEAIVKSIELDPAFDPGRRILHGRWAVLQRELRHLPTRSTISAIASEYRGAAGGNPSLTLWTELWGVIHEKGIRFWSEMTPVPTRKNSMRWVETYAGWEGESTLLNNLMDLTLVPEQGGRQMTAGELGMVQDSDGVWKWPFAETTSPEDIIPCWVNDAARMFMFYDTGEAARRQPWQQGVAGAAYYRQEEKVHIPSEFRRLHYNERVSAVSAFIPIEWWDAQKTEIPPLAPGDRTHLVVAMDAATSDDCFGIVTVSRHPERRRDVMVRRVWKTAPPPGGKINYGKTAEPEIRTIVNGYRVAVVTYDPYQLHELATRLSEELRVWFDDFSQGADRLKADKQLYDLIKEGRIWHDGNLDLREHMQHAAAKKYGTEEDSKLRIVKKNQAGKIDLVVALSMAAYMCLELDL